MNPGATLRQQQQLELAPSGSRQRHIFTPPVIFPGDRFFEIKQAPIQCSGQREFGRLADRAPHARIKDAIEPHPDCGIGLHAFQLLERVLESLEELLGR